eukprot:symbB.v1.2.009679.t1/scaffold589.1/size183863/14
MRKKGFKEGIRHFLGSLFLKRTFPLVTVVAFAWLKLRKTRVAEGWSVVPIFRGRPERPQIQDQLLSFRRSCRSSLRP